MGRRAVPWAHQSCGWGALDLVELGGGLGWHDLWVPVSTGSAVVRIALRLGPAAD